MKRARKRRLGRPRLQDAPAGRLRTPERILEAAAELFSEQGYASAPMSAIAERADLTSGAIYAHFKSKGDLLLAVIKRALKASPMNEIVASAHSGAPRPLPEFVSMYVDPSRLRLRRLAIEIHAAAVREKRVADLLTDANRRVVAAFRARLEADVAEGEADVVNLDYAARLLLVLGMGLAHLDTLAPELLGDREFETWVEQALVRMLDESQEDAS